MVVVETGVLRSFAALRMTDWKFAETVEAFPLRGRWPEGPDEVASNGKPS